MSAVDARLERIADGFSFPTSLTFDDDCTAYVAEAGLPFGGVPPSGRVWMLGADGGRELIADDLRPPVNGLTWHEGSLYISEGGHPARISRLARDGELTTILDGLPGPGNYHTNMTVFGPDGKLYFSQGAMTNSAIVGLDAYELGWLRRLPHAHDLPGYDILLAGVNCETADPLHGDDARTETGAFVPFGERGEAGTTVAAQLPCTAAVMRCNPDGSELELVAWGLRNAYGLGFLEDGRLLAIDQGADDRGSRPIGAAPDVMFEVREGAWYGWPDFVGGDPVTDPRYRPQRGPEPRFLLANHDELPPPEQPLVRFPPHSAAVRFAVSTKGCLVVALFGDEAPMTVQAGVPQGRSVVRVDVGEWTVRPLELDGLLRPIDVRFDQEGALWVLDFGRFEMTATGVAAEPETGALYRLAERCR
jgi:glucose/arabinose dehydrogenase